LVSKVAEENEEETQTKWAQKEDKRETIGEDPSALQASSVSSSRYARFFIFAFFKFARTLREGNLIAFEQCHARVLWPSRVTGLGQWPGRAGLGLAQSM
jgi:hypothetical protein